MIDALCGLVAGGLHDSRSRWVVVVMEDAHTKSVGEIVAFFQVEEEAGLSDEQIQRAQEKYGANGNIDIFVEKTT